MQNRRKNRDNAGSLHRSVACLLLFLCSCTASQSRLVNNSADETGRQQSRLEWDGGEVGISTISSPRRTVIPASATVDSSASIRAAAYFQPAVPRQPALNTALRRASFQNPNITPNRLAQLYPDEYLFDGGDRDLPVHFDDFQRHGLDTEDSIAEYTDHLGKRHLRASNRVAVFAPRFAAVRTIDNPVAGVTVKKLAGTERANRGRGLLARVAVGRHLQKLSPNGVRMRSRVGGLDSQLSGHSAQQTKALVIHDKVVNLFQDLAFFKTGRFAVSEEARLAVGMRAARVWSHRKFPVLVKGLDAISQVEVKAQAAELVGKEDQRRTPGRLRIVKLADKKTAIAGDLITFTIRYDNLGDRELSHIRIIDNLTPRLEYVDDSATSNRAGKLVVEDNEEGSLVLKFELSEPLPGHRGGVVTFQAKVR